MSVQNASKTMVRAFGPNIRESFAKLEEHDQLALASIVRRPDINVRYKSTSDTIRFDTRYGNFEIKANELSTIDRVYVNGQRYNIKGDGVETIGKLVGDYDDIISVLDSPIGYRAGGRRARNTYSMDDAKTQEQHMDMAFDDLRRAGINYNNIFEELGAALATSNLEVLDVFNDLRQNDIEEHDIPRHLIYDSPYKKEIISRLYNYTINEFEDDRNFEPVQADDTTFVGRLLTSLNRSEGEYDREHGILSIKESANGKTYTRSITNLPDVDENGIFRNGTTRYIPHYIGYFCEGDASRVERLRVIDPVQQALDGVRLHYNLTSAGDIRFKSILDVSRNLTDFENHPYGDEILATLKNKVVLSSRYRESNSLLAEYGNVSDELGAVALTMLDDDAKYIIDPYGTSNGRNLGITFYLCDGVTIDKEGKIHPQTQIDEAGNTIVTSSEFSKVGEVINEYGVDGDNFNRNQMSFNAFLTSTDIKPRNVFFAEFGLWNSEDAVILMNDLGEGYKTGDKLEDFHGNKSTIAFVLSELSDEEIKERKLEAAVEFAKANPHVEIIASPASLASRLNMGIIKEGLAGDKQPVTLHDGTVLDDACVELMYMRLPQTAEHKSKDYALEGGGRRYSTLLRYALSSKVGDLYREGLIDESVRQGNIDEAASVFQRLGVTFEDDMDLVKNDNVNLTVDALVTVPMSEFQHVSPSKMRLELMDRMNGFNEINIDVGEIELPSRLHGDPIRDSRGRNVLPIRIPEGGTIPCRYMSILQEISRGNYEGIKDAHRTLSSIDYGQLTTKNNILKNIDTMIFTKGAKTTVIVPDPSVGLGEVRSNSEDSRLIIHRDPAIQSGNAISVVNAGHARPNVLHVNPLMINMVDGDFDGDTMGENDFSNLTLSDEKKDLFFARSSVEEQVNYYGNVFLSTGGAHFKALAKVNDIDTSDITFDDGKSNAELVALVEAKTQQMITSPASYGAYALQFTNEQVAKESLCRLADDGIKGNRSEIEARLNGGYSKDDNRALAKALIAKSEWTGLAGATTNNLISELGEGNYEITRVALDVTHSMTQAVLQMKKDAERLPEIDGKIKDMKKVMRGDLSIDDSRALLKETTAGLLPEKAVDQFIDVIAAKQIRSHDDNSKDAFGVGIINGNDMTTTKLSYQSAKKFEDALKELGDSYIPQHKL